MQFINIRENYFNCSREEYQIEYHYPVVYFYWQLFVACNRTMRQLGCDTVHLITAKLPTTFQFLYVCVNITRNEVLNV